MHVPVCAAGAGYPVSSILVCSSGSSCVTILVRSPRPSCGYEAGTVAEVAVVCGVARGRVTVCNQQNHVFKEAVFGRWYQQSRQYLYPQACIVGVTLGVIVLVDPCLSLQTSSVEMATGNFENTRYHVPGYALWSPVGNRPSSSLHRRVSCHLSE